MQHGGEDAASRSAQVDLAQIGVVWAKWRRGGDAFHPLICHMIDVALVAQSMWESVIPPAARRRVAAALRVSPDEAGLWIALWAGLHDIGKASPTFQSMVPAAMGPLEQNGLGKLGDVPKIPHGTVSAVVLPDLLTGVPFGLARSLAVRLAIIVGGHHGIFPRSEELIRAEESPRAIGAGRWSEARQSLAWWLAQTVGQPRYAPTGAIDNATAMWLAGLVSVADWIGSDEQFFHYAVSSASDLASLDLPRYREQSQQAVSEALTRLGWNAWPANTSPRTFADLFPFSPRPVQAATCALAPELAGPALAILEVPMGEGKTEAAMYLADYQNAVNGQRGHYFALPTQATSDQMFGRVEDFLRRCYPGEVVNVQLLHGLAALSAEFQMLQRLGEELLTPSDICGPDGQDGAPASVIAAEWFTYRKRGLLAPFGVGTVDQALLAALQTRHVFVRLFGLANKTIIIDEVHAYDAYMSTLLERLLMWLGALGSSVILLSATLPVKRREQLLAAYVSGQGTETPALTDDAAAAYPRVTWFSEAGAGAAHVETSSASRKRLQVQWVGQAEPVGAWGQRLQTALADGGCAAVICNTVGRAQEVYRTLKPLFPGLADDGQPELDLLHARFLYEQRQAREHRAVVRFGKPGSEDATDGASGRRPHRAVLVATQVIEQSLDLDFDLMVTDLAPADLVLQRAGRLHRHGRPRPAGLHDSNLWIIGPLPGSEVPMFDRGSVAVYDEHILLRSWLALQHLPAIQIPEDVEALIEAVYDGRSCPEEAGEAIRQQWDTTLTSLEDQLEWEVHEAQVRWLKPPGFRGQFWRITEDPREEEASDYHAAHRALTRLGADAVDVVFLYGSPERPSFDSAGRERASLAAPSIESAQRLLRRAVGISDRRVINHLKDLETPAGWRRSPLLRHHRLLVLDGNQGAVVGKYRITLEQDLGVVVTDVGREDE